MDLPPGLAATQVFGEGAVAEAGRDPGLDLQGRAVLVVAVEELLAAGTVTSHGPRGAAREVL